MMLGQVRDIKYNNEKTEHEESEREEQSFI